MNIAVCKESEGHLHIRKCTTDVNLLMFLSVWASQACVRPRDLVSFEAHLLNELELLGQKGSCTVHQFPV